MRQYTEGSREGVSPILQGGKMDFGALPVYDGRIAPVPEPTLNLAWFERSSAGESVAPERATDSNGALLDRVREAEGLVYNGDGDYES